jgi:hypothetical protein
MRGFVKADNGAKGSRYIIARAIGREYSVEINSTGLSSRIGYHRKHWAGPRQILQRTNELSRAFGS